MLVIERIITKPRIDNFLDSGKKIEVLVHSFDTLIDFMECDLLLRKPCHIRICCDAIVLHETGACCQDIKAIAHDLLIKGPAPLTEEDLSVMRHEVVKFAEDLQGCRDDFERLILVADLTERCINYYLGLSNTWQGQNRWIVRELRFFSPVVAEILYNALDTFHVTGDLTLLFKFAGDLLKLPYDQCNAAAAA
jgi:hypothetical protein